MSNKPTTATEYLSACAQVQLERGGEYDASGTGAALTRRQRHLIALQENTCAAVMFV